MSKKKIMASSIAAVLLIATLVSATLAYFKDESEVLDNKFTVGEGVFIKSFDEAEIVVSKDDDGLTTWEETGNRIEDGQDYGTLMPGDEVKKDPTLRIAENSEPCWAFIKIDVSKYMSLLMMYGQLNNVDLADLDLTKHTVREDVVDTYIEGLKHAEWTVMNPEVLEQAAAYYAANRTWPTTLSVIIGYNTILKGGDFVQVFEKIKMPAGITNEMMVNVPNFARDDYNLDLTAYVVQAKGLDQAAAYAEAFPA